MVGRLSAVAQSSGGSVFFALVRSCSHFLGCPRTDIELNAGGSGLADVDDGGARGQSTEAAQ
jgi:hypothetical protein